MKTIFRSILLALVFLIVFTSMPEYSSSSSSEVVQNEISSFEEQIDLGLVIEDGNNHKEHEEAEQTGVQKVTSSVGKEIGKAVKGVIGAIVKAVSSLFS